MNFGIVAIIGTGLIGGSIGLGLKERGLAGSIIGVGHRRTSIKRETVRVASDYKSSIGL